MNFKMALILTFSPRENESRAKLFGDFNDFVYADSSPLGRGEGEGKAFLVKPPNRP